MISTPHLSAGEMNPPGRRRGIYSEEDNGVPELTVPGSVLLKLKASVFLGFQAGPMNNETDARIRRKQPRAHPKAPSKHTFTPSGRRSSTPSSKCLDPSEYG